MKLRFAPGSTMMMVSLVTRSLDTTGALTSSNRVQLVSSRREVPGLLPVKRSGLEGVGPREGGDAEVGDAVGVTTPMEQFMVCSVTFCAP